MKLTVKRWLLAVMDAPGAYRPRDIAAALDVPCHEVLRAHALSIRRGLADSVTRPHPTRAGFDVLHGIRPTRT